MTTPIVYSGPAHVYLCLGPSGETYRFERGVALDVDDKDAAWFLGEASAQDFEVPSEPEPEASPSGEFVRFDEDAAHAEV